jgi:aldose 1-epimerase
MKEVFGKTKDGDTVTAYTINNNNGMSATIIDFGATVTKLIVPDKNGVGRDIMLGYDTVAEYEEGDKFFGAIIGRNANRICEGKATINGTTYQMDQNDHGNNLHSGNNGVDKKLWTVIGVDDNSVTLICKSNDMEQGLPGDLTMTVKYLLTDDNEFKIIYDADAEKKTIINLTSHMYFNLNGDKSGDILDHVVKINADYYNPVIDSKAIPTEENAPVEGTVFDFRTPKQIGQDINEDVDQLKFVGGYDNNYVIDGTVGKMRHFATVYSEESGIQLDLFSDQTGTQFYSGNFVGEQLGKGGFAYHKRSGLCLEPQYIPNSMNFIAEGEEMSPIFDAQEKYHTVSLYKFSVK